MTQTTPTINDTTLTLALDTVSVTAEAAVDYCRERLGEVVQGRSTLGLQWIGGHVVVNDGQTRWVVDAQAYVDAAEAVTARVVAAVAGCPDEEQLAEALSEQEVYQQLCDALSADWTSELSQDEGRAWLATVAEEHREELAEALGIEVGQTSLDAACADLEAAGYTVDDSEPGELRISNLAPDSDGESTEPGSAWDDACQDILDTIRSYVTPHGCIAHWVDDDIVIEDAGEAPDEDDEEAEDEADAEEPAERPCECHLLYDDSPRCDGVGADAVAETMPRWLRASHDAAGNSGSYPHNGAIRAQVIEDHVVLDEWTRIVGMLSDSDA